MAKLLATSVLAGVSLSVQVISSDSVAPTSPTTGVYERVVAPAITARTVAAAVRDNGGEPEFLGVIPDDEAALRAAFEKARDDFDAVIVRSATCISGRILEAAKNLKVVGRAGIGVDNIDIAAEDVEQLLAFARSEQIDLTIVGPEAPLVAGIVDRFEAAGLVIFGPSAAAAQLEGSKSFTKDFLARHRIPTGTYRTFTGLAALVFENNQLGGLTAAARNRQQGAHA